MNDDPTAEALDAYMDAATILTALRGPMTEAELARYLTTDGENRNTLTWCWLKLVCAGRLVGDGLRHGSTAWRPERPGEPLERLGSVSMTPTTAIATRARIDQNDADERDMTDEDWERLEAEVNEVTRETDG